MSGKRPGLTGKSDLVGYPVIAAQGDASNCYPPRIAAVKLTNLSLDHLA